MAESQPQEILPDIIPCSAKTVALKGDAALFICTSFPYRQVSVKLNSTFAFS